MKYQSSALILALFLSSTDAKSATTQVQKAVETKPKYKFA